MNHASLFSGIGAPEVAAAMLGWENVFHCEINPFGKQVLEYWFPNSVSYEDITKTNFTKWRGRIFILAHVADTDCGDDVRGSGEDEGKGKGKGLSERYQIREPGEPDKLRPEIQGATENTISDGCRLGEYAEQGSKRDQRHISARDDERICKEERIYSSDSDSRRGREIPPAIYSREPDGDEPLGYGSESYATNSPDLRLSRTLNTGTKGEICKEVDGERDNAECGLSIKTASSGGATANTNGTGLQEPQQPGREKDSEKEGTGLDDRVIGFSSDGRNITDTFCERLEGQDEPRDSERGERLRVRGDSPRYDWATNGSLLPENRWRNFPTVSPVHRGNDGLCFNVDDLTIPFSKWRTESLKAYGNAICVQVVYEIFRAIEEVTHERI